MELINVHFDDNRKRQGLTFHEDEQQVGDKSRKGSVDVRILSLVQEINETQDFFTTSSCSGRAILFTHDAVTSEDTPKENTSATSSPEIPSGSGIKSRKKGCRWLFVTHDEVVPKEFLSAWTDIPVGTNTTFKIEPSIFHIQCRSMTGAKKLLNTGTVSGFRNSGMVVGKDNKMTVAIRSAIGMEVPLKKGLGTEIPEKFLFQLLQEGNSKLTTSWQRTEVFRQNFLKTFCA